MLTGLDLTLDTAVAMPSSAVFESNFPRFIVVVVVVAVQVSRCGALVDSSKPRRYEQRVI